MSKKLRPIAFQVAASMVLWECYCSMGKPTEARVDHIDVLRVVLPAGMDINSDEAIDLALVCLESVEAAPAWLEKEGLIRAAGYQSLDGCEWELTSRGVSALNLTLALNSQVPERTAGEYLGDLVEKVKAEADASAPRLLVEGVVGFFRKIGPMLTALSQ